MFELKYRMIIRDKNGRIKEKSNWKTSKSFVRNFLKWIYAINAGLTNVVVVDTGGVNRTILCITGAGATTDFPKLGYFLAPVNIDDYGIVVGTGTDAEANNDHKLATQIAHGAGGGQLEYGSVTETDPAVVVGNVDSLWTRNFSNSSGGNITVEEIGFVMRAYDSGGVVRYMLFLRDLATKEVLNGDTLTVQYKIRTSV